MRALLRVRASMSCAVCHDPPNRTDALCHCEDIARMHMEREKESSEIQETMSGVIAELRAAALVVAQEGMC